MYSNLPSIDALTDYRPKIPLRVWTADGMLIGEFGEERRDFVPVADMPDELKKAILAAEDDRFYRASRRRLRRPRARLVSNFASGRRGQGGSTITMQVARNFFLSSERSYIRKIYEIALAYKIESSLSKDRIFEVYVNQIFLGQRAYGFAAASQVYFGKKLKDLTSAEIATLAGLPVAPAHLQPFRQSEARQESAAIRAGAHAAARLHRSADARCSAGAGTQAARAPLRGRTGVKVRLHAEYAAELARQLVFEVFRDETYTRGLNVSTTLRQDDQETAYAALRKQVLDYDRKYGYRGPEAFIELVADPVTRDQRIEDALVEAIDSPNLLPAVVLEASPQLRCRRCCKAAQRSISRPMDCASRRRHCRRRRSRNARLFRAPWFGLRAMTKAVWRSCSCRRSRRRLSPRTRAMAQVSALVGGFDFNLNKFNHVTQAWRQPGSSFKPFIYSASLEKGFMPSTLINDAPIIIDPDLTGGQVWEPKNYDGKFEGPMRLRQGLAKSKNLVSIRILQAIGPRYAQDWITRFGFDAEKHPAYLTMALGAGSVTPWQMLNAYAVFANGGYGVQLHLISKITDANGKC